LSEDPWECLACGSLRPNRSGVCPTCGLKSGTVPSNVFKPIQALPVPPAGKNATSDTLSLKPWSDPSSDDKKYTNYLDRAINEQFRVTQDGRRLFFPSKSYWRTKSYQGYVVSSDNECVRLRKRQRHWLTVAVLPASVASILIANRAYDSTGSLCMGFIMWLVSFAPFWVSHILWLRSECRGLAKTEEKY
jgi:hypothetical protein